MITNVKVPRDIDEYISRFPENIQEILEKIRHTIREAAPDASETISYQMPAFKQNGILVYFAAFNHHIGFYPTASGTAAFRKVLEGYPCSKGTIQFPYSKPIPFDIISDIVKFRVAENLGKVKGHAKR
jgi:uncharacterized protein YdhG (YjbR/CyaY superfamily)